MLNMAMEEISRKLMARSNINDTLASVINIGREAIGAESVILGLVQGDDLVISHVDGIPWLRPGTLMRIEDDRISSNVIRTGRPMMCNGISENELSGTAKKLSARSRIVVPIRMAERTLGTLSFNIHTSSGPFSDAHLDFAEKLSYSLSLALETASLTFSELMTGAYLETIVRTVPDGVVAFNNAGQFIYVNDEAEKILGRKKEEIRSMSYDDPRWRLRSLDGTMLKSEQMPFQAVMSSKSPARDVKFKIERGDGNDVIISMNFSPITSPNKEIDSIVASMTDITELKRGGREAQGGNEAPDDAHGDHAIGHNGLGQ